MSAPSGPPPPSTQDESSAQEPVPRIIDENTDLSTLSDQEIMRLMDGMDHNEDAMSKVRCPASSALDDESGLGT